MGAITGDSGLTESYHYAPLRPSRVQIDRAQITG